MKVKGYWVIRNNSGYPWDCCVFSGCHRLRVEHHCLKSWRTAWGTRCFFPLTLASLTQDLPLLAAALDKPTFLLLCTAHPSSFSFPGGFYFPHFYFFWFSTARGLYILLAFFNYGTFGLVGHLFFFFLISLFNLLLLKIFLLTMISIDDLLPIQWFHFFILPNLSKTFPITAYSFIFWLF